MHKLSTNWREFDSFLDVENIKRRALFVNHTFFAERVCPRSRLANIENYDGLSWNLPSLVGS